MEGFCIGRKGYLTCGRISSGTYTNQLWEYEATTDTWTQKANFGGSAREHPVAVVLNGEGYVGCGWSAAGNCGDFFKYNPGSNTWIPIPNFPGTIRHHPAGFAVGSKLYVGTGHDVASQNNRPCTAPIDNASFLGKCR